VEVPPIYPFDAWIVGVLRMQVISSPVLLESSRNPYPPPSYLCYLDFPPGGRLESLKFLDIAHFFLFFFFFPRVHSCRSGLKIWDSSVDGDLSLLCRVFCGCLVTTTSVFFLFPRRFFLSMRPWFFFFLALNPAWGLCLFGLDGGEPMSRSSSDIESLFRV